METLKSTINLYQYGISDIQSVIYNPSYEDLFLEEIHPDLTGFEKGQLTQSGAVNVLTGKFTGRSPKDKYIVYDDTTKKTIWWTSSHTPNDNKPITPKIWKELKEDVCKDLSCRKLFVVDAFCGANKNTQLKVRFVTEVAWQAHFVTNMFIRPTKEELNNFGEPDFVVLNASKMTNTRWVEQNMHSEVFTVFNLTEKMQLIGGTWYGGEMKKGIFAMMNYYLPLEGIATMHCSANMGKNNDVAIFFGLSGTGKTTLSTDPHRYLVGDDEHGWDDEGIFNFEGGCYAKTINLNKESEPDIYHAIKRNALLENVTVYEDGTINYNDNSVTENTRVSYPIYHINNIIKPVSKAGHANKVIFLTADAFGVMPPVSILNKGQTQYHFLSGFTAKLAGTELGIKEPVPTFSACFGEAFLSLHPTKYAEELRRKMEEHNTKAYLVNTGWNGSGKRISINDTRAIINAILDGSIEKAETKTIPVFNLTIPVRLHDVDPNIMDPRDTYKSPKEWTKKAIDLAQKFIINFSKYTDSPIGKEIEKSGPEIEL